MTVISSQQRLLVFDMKAILIEPNGYSVTSKSPLGVNVETLNTDITMSIDNS